jgi:hypothetical protein
MPFRHDAGIFRPNGVSRRNFDGMKTPNPRCFGVWVVIGKKVEAKNPNEVSAKCAMVLLSRGTNPATHAGRWEQLRWRVCGSHIHGRIFAFFTSPTDDISISVLLCATLKHFTIHQVRV